MQTLHYLTLCIISPPLLAAFADAASLDYEGGASSVGMSHEPLLLSFDAQLIKGWSWIGEKWLDGPQ